MNCSLLDIGCHIQGAAWEWWAGVGLLNKALIVGGLVLVILAAARGVLALIHKVGGWPAVIGFVLVVVVLVLAMLPRKPEPKAKSVAGEKAKGPFEFGVDRLKPKRGKPSDAFKDWISGGGG